MLQLSTDFLTYLAIYTNRRLVLAVIFKVSDVVLEMYPINWQLPLPGEVLQNSSKKRLREVKS